MILTDIAIIGGGISGLWLLDSFKTRGFKTLLFEKQGLGAGQTLASQGMIHGGVKYSLGGFNTRASQTISAMPGIWQQCLNGEILPDLRNVKRLSDCYYLFSDGSAGSRLTAFLGSKAVRGNLSRLASSDLPKPFNHHQFKGVVYKLSDTVLDTASLITELAKPHRADLIHSEPTPVPDNKSGISGLLLSDGTEVRAKCYLFCAGSGNARLLADSQMDSPMQTRPLHQVMVKGHDLPLLYAHAIGLPYIDKPRMTITSHRTADQCTVWYLGGGVAESGVNRTESDQINFAHSELKGIFPYIDFDTCQWVTLRVDRAEPKQGNRARPDTPFSKRLGNVIVCWPTKLTLVPLMASAVLSQVTELPANPGATDLNTTGKMPMASIAQLPWDAAF